LKYHHLTRDWVIEFLAPKLSDYAGHHHLLSTTWSAG
jgi:hypothetical protein